MSRVVVLVILAALLVGCGDSASGGANNAPTGGNIDSVTMDKPTETKVGPISMKDACDKAGLKPYPGSEKGSGDTYKRGDGGFKDDLTFTTSDSIEKVAGFFKGQGLDTKVLPMEATSMGHTKGGANVIISYKSSGKETTVSIKSVRYDAPAK